jgi:F-type H+-transporting ATPase subunit b
MIMADAVHTGTEAAHGDHGSGVFPPFDPATFETQLIWLALVFGTLYLLMSRVALPRVAGILETRRAAIQGDLDAAANLKAETDDAIKAYEKALADAKANAQAIASETHARLAAATDAKRKAVDADLAGKLAASEAAILKGRDQAMSNVQSIAADAAETIIERLLGKAPARGDVEAAVAQSLKG